MVILEIMSGHSHWAGIKRKKEVTDVKRGVVFSKLLAAVTAAARTEPDPNFNPRLRTAIEKAREANVPKENIERAISKAKEAGEALEELTFEAYGPGGAAIVIDAISDSRNRTVQEIKKLLNDFGGKWAETGSCLWAFETLPDGSRKARFPQEISGEDRAKLILLVETLENQNDVQRVYTTVKD